MLVTRGCRIAETGFKPCNHAVHLVNEPLPQVGTDPDVALDEYCSSHRSQGFKRDLLVDIKRRLFGHDRMQPRRERRRFGIDEIHSQIELAALAWGKSSGAWMPFAHNVTPCM